MTPATEALATIRTYPARNYLLPAYVSAILGGLDLARLHETYPAAENPASDQDSEAHRAFYAGFGAIERQYRDFVADQVLPLHNADLCVQRVPTFRVARPGGLAVSEWHTDAEYAHQPETVNYWVPLTPAHGTATVWLESAPGAGDYAPAGMDPGEFLEFRATLLRHGNQPNDTGRSRVSFDFRVIPLYAYKDSGKTTVSRSVPLRLGGYYTLLTAAGQWSEAV